MTVELESVGKGQIWRQRRLSRCFLLAYIVVECISETVREMAGLAAI